MQKYRVLIRGRNLLTAVDGVRQRLGFYTNVFIEALSPTDAESRAIDLMRDDVDLREAAFNPLDDPVRFSAEEVIEIDSFAGLRLPRTGLSVFPESTAEP